IRSRVRAFASSRVLAVLEQCTGAMAKRSTPERANARTRERPAKRARPEADMSTEALLAILITAGLICLMVGAQRDLKRRRSALDKRLRRYGGRAFQLTDDEQKRRSEEHTSELQ